MEYVCCSVQFPNPFHLATLEQRHPLAIRLILMIMPDFLWVPGTRFCPCNAAKDKEAHIGEGCDTFMSLFADTVPGSGT